MTIPCPNSYTCGGELTFYVYTDSDGEGPWSRSFTVAELESQTCGCEFADAQLNALCERAAEMAAEAGAPDYI